MSINYQLIAIFFLGFSHTICSQNLLRNGDFEKYITLPSGLSQIDGVLSDWENVNQNGSFFPNGSPDYIHKKGTGEGRVDEQGKTLYGVIQPHSMSGMIYLNLCKKEATFSEYITQKLDKPLIKGAMYKIKFYASVGQITTYNKLSTNGIGIGFSESRLTQNLAEPVSAPMEMFVKDVWKHSDWNDVEFTFEAKGKYNYITIGLFIPKSERKLLEISPIQHQGAGMFIDDISLEEIPTEAKTKKKEEQTRKPIVISDTSKQPIVIKNNEVEKKLESRKLSIAKEITVPSDTFSFAIWDNELEDGDVISLIYNDKEIISNYKLLNKKRYFQIQVEKGKENTLVMYAHNLGEVAPNTAVLQLLFGERKMIVLESNLKKSKAIRFIRD